MSDHSRLIPVLENLVKENDYDLDAFYIDMLDDPIIQDLERHLGRSITEDEQEFIFDNFDATDYA